MIAAALSSAGLRVGLHTSPHFDGVEERFAVDGRTPSREQFARLVLEARPHIEAIDAALPDDQPELTYFEITTALAFEQFRREQVDWAVIEVGMGGRLDATNVVEPAVSVVTSISLDHTRQLGNTLSAIAREKAGIIKPGRPVVCGVLQAEPREEITNIARELGSPIKQLEVDFHYECRESESGRTSAQVRTWMRRWPALSLRLKGEHQARNAAVALAVADALVELGLANLETTLVAEALSELRIPGRFEIILEQPLAVADVAHNQASAAALAQTLESIPRRPSPGKRVLLFGASRDKQWPEMLDLLCPHFDHLVLTASQGNFRALTCEEFRERLRDWPIPITFAENPADAWQTALACSSGREADALFGAGEGPAANPGFICVTGSFYLVAEVRRLVRTAPLMVH